MSEIKAVSFRLGDEDIQKFREFAEEQGMNQAEMFQALVNNFEMARAKGMISDRAKEIETFQATVNNLVSMFVNSLAVNQTSEERIREMLSLELTTKDKTIADLQSRNKTMTTRLSEAEKDLEKNVGLLREMSNKVNELRADLSQKNSMVFDYQRQITLLNNIVEEYRPYKDENEARKVKNAELKEQIGVLQHSNEDLQSQLTNLERMKDFYQSEVDNLRAENKDIRANFREAEAAHKAELEKLRQELTTKFNEELNSKIEFEKSKYQLELDKALNREQVLQAQLKAKKTAKSTKTTK